MQRHDDELPEDHSTLLEFAADVAVDAPPLVASPVQVPDQRGVVISDAASSLVEGPEGPLIGVSTHGR
jgi:hypothetical protein